MKYFISIILILLILSCSLKRTNPLDPLVSGEGYPGDVHNVHVELHLNNTVTITWTAVPDVDGYYIYSSQSYDGLYELITPEGIEAPINGYEDSFEFFPESGRYWYKISAYIELDEGELEGYRSDSETWY